LEKSDREFSSSSERENMMNINAFARRRRKHFAQKREQKRYTYSHRHLDSPGRLAADFHVEKDNWVRHILWIKVFLFAYEFVVEKWRRCRRRKKRDIFPFLWSLSPLLRELILVRSCLYIFFSLLYFTARHTPRTYLCVFSFYSYETAVNAGCWKLSFTIDTARTTKSTMMSLIWWSQKINLLILTKKGVSEQNRAFTRETEEKFPHLF
jgi:hypothetical protein